MAARGPWHWVELQDKLLEREGWSRQVARRGGEQRLRYGRNKISERAGGEGKGIRDT